MLTEKQIWECVHSDKFKININKCKAAAERVFLREYVEGSWTLLPLHPKILHSEQPLRRATVQVEVCHSLGELGRPGLC